MIEFVSHVAPVLVPVVVVLLVADLLWAFATWDRIIKLEFQKYPVEWQKDGKPPGYFWKTPPSAYSSYWDRLRAIWHRGWLISAWLFRSPAWARSDAKASGLLIRFRLLVAIWNLSILLPLITLAIASAFHLL